MSAKEVSSGLAQWLTPVLLVIVGYLYIKDTNNSAAERKDIKEKVTRIDSVMTAMYYREQINLNKSALLIAKNDAEHAEFKKGLDSLFRESYLFYTEFFPFIEYNWSKPMRPKKIIIPKIR